jgi:hypothetical protein
VEDKIIDGLNFNLEPGASYVLNRRFCTFHPSGSNIYTPRSLIRIVLTGANDWLDPSTLRIMFDLRNNDPITAHNLRPIGGPHSFFRRMRILMGGTLVEDIDSYNRTHQMFDQLIAGDSRKNKMVEGFGQEIDIAEYFTAFELSGVSLTNPPEVLLPSTYNGIPGGQSQTVLFKPLSGLFSQNKYIPLKYAGPIIIELELVADHTETVIQPMLDSEILPTYYSQYFAVTNTTTTPWNIENVQVKCDVCTLDNKVENIFTQHMLDGGSFPLRYNNYISQTQPTAGALSVMVNITRTASRLKSCFVTMNRNSGYLELKGANRSWNEFWSPMYSRQLLKNNFVYNSQFELDSCYIQIGSKIYPEYPIRSHAEAFYQLTKCLGIQASDIHNLDINPKQYHVHKFIIGIDLEKVLEARGTGFNTKAGDLLTVFFKHKNNGETADDISTVLVSENILNLSNVGVEVHD